MAGNRQTRFLIVLATLAIAGLVAACIYYGSRNTYPRLTAEEARELVHLKNVGLGALENQKLAEALQAFEPLLARLPVDPLPARNVAVARVVALGDEDKPNRTAETIAAAQQALAEVKRQEGENTEYHWLALQVAMLAEDRTQADVHLAAILKAQPRDPAAWYARFRAFQIGFPNKLDPQALEALEEASKLSPENAWFRHQWLVTMANYLSEDPPPKLDATKLKEQLAATGRAFEPFAHVLKLLYRVEVQGHLEAAAEAIAAGDPATAAFKLRELSNVVVQFARLDLHAARRHPLEFVLDDFQPGFYQAQLEQAPLTESVIEVQFKPLSFPLDSPDDDQLTGVLDFELIDFDLDGLLDLVLLNAESVAVWSRPSLDKPWRQLATAPAEGFTHLLAQDLDADFTESGAAVRALQAEPAKSGSPALKNGCPSADIDLLLFGPAGVLLMENRFDRDTQERTLAPIMADNLPAQLKNVTAAATADLEADGDLDLVIAAEGGLQLWSSIGNWKFADVSARSALPEPTLALTQLLPVDWDRDVDIDILIASPDGTGWLENVRHGQFRWRAFDGDFSFLKSARALEVCDVDGNASWDLIGAVNEGVQLITTKTPASGAVRLASTSVISQSPAIGLLSWDYDNDGHDDLLASSETGVQLLRGDGAGKFAETDALGEIKSPVRKAVTDDLEGDGDLDLALLSQGELLLWDNDGGNANHWLDVALQAQQDTNNQPAPSGRISPFGNGSLLELKAGQRYQAKLVRGQSTHFGLGKADQADVVRVMWVNGVPQNILQPKANLFVCEQQTLNTSCPYLYTWDGEKFVFATDLLWNSPLGLQFAEGVLAQPRPWEYLKVPGEQLAAKEGHYELQLTEELWEAAYFDQVRLIAIDHPADASIYSNEKVGPAEISEYKIHTVREHQPLRAARNHHGRDLMKELAAPDGDYACVHDRKLRQGVTEETYLELDLGNVPDAKQVTLFLTGWIYPSSTSINVALSQGGTIPPPKPPALLVPDPQGGWKEALPFMGFPGGKTKTIAVDLTGLLAQNDGRVRIATTMELYWDHIFYSVDEPPVEVRTTELPLVAANLHERGYSRVVPGKHHGPEQYLYHEVSTVPKWPSMQGSFTPFGNVLPLLEQADDRLLVIGAGDEVTLRFMSPAEPPPPGWKRDFFFYSAGWEKDCNLLTVLGETADPLPFQAMRGYPWPADQQPPKRFDPLTRTQPPAFWKAIQRW